MSSPLPPQSDSWYKFAWPVLLITIPPAIEKIWDVQIVGRVMEQATMGIVGVYLYGMLRVPWELYRQSRRSLDAVQTPSLVHRAILHITLILVILSPFLGPYFLEKINTHLTAAPHNPIISHSQIQIYVFCSGLLPIWHLISLLRSGSSHNVVMSEDDLIPQHQEDRIRQGLLKAQQEHRTATSRSIETLQQKIEKIEGRLTDMQLASEQTAGNLERLEAKFRDWRDYEDKRAEAFDRRLQMLEKGGIVAKRYKYQGSRPRSRPPKQRSNLASQTNGFFYTTLHVTLDVIFLPLRIATSVTRNLGQGVSALMMSIWRHAFTGMLGQARKAQAAEEAEFAIETDDSGRSEDDIQPDLLRETARHLAQLKAEQHSNSMAAEDSDGEHPKHSQANSPRYAFRQTMGRDVLR